MSRKSLQVSIDPKKRLHDSVVVHTPPDACHFGQGVNILMGWRKSIYKMVWRHSLIFLGLYFALSLVYNFGLNKEMKKNFDELTEYFARSSRSLNWMIILGFFTNTALQRMFNMQMTMPGTSKPITVFVMSLKPDLPEGPDIVDQYARWIVLMWILTFRTVCKPLREEFPDLESIQHAGLLREQEKRVLERNKGYNVPRPLIVLEWILLLLKESLIHDRFINKSSHNKNVEALMTFKKGCSNIVKFSIQNIPNAVIQAVIILVYWSGMTGLVARNLPKFDNEVVRSVISYFPIMPYMQFFVFFGWLSFGRAAVNPFGSDETDIDIRKLSKKHIQNSMLLKDIYTKKLEDIFPNLPHKKFMDNTIGPLTSKLQSQEENKETEIVHNL